MYGYTENKSAGETGKKAEKKLVLRSIFNFCSQYSKLTFFLTEKLLAPIVSSSKYFCHYSYTELITVRLPYLTRTNKFKMSSQALSADVQTGVMLLLKLICRLSKTRQYHSYFALQKLTTTRLPSLLSLYRYNYYHTLTSNLPKTQHNTTQHNIIINYDIIYYQKMFNPPFIKICNAIGIIDVTST